MKKKLIFFLLAMAVSACTDKLDQINPNSLVAEVYWKTDNDFLQGIAASYKLFKAYDRGFWGSKNICTVANARGDDAYPQPADNVTWYQIGTFTNNAANDVSENLYNASYTSIFRANQVIDNAVAAPISADSKKQFIAEGKFIRALNYFILVTNWGEVPLFVKLAADPSDAYKAKSTEAEVWNQIISDFTDAAAGLPVSYSSQYVGRATKGAAIGLLGKSYLYNGNLSEAENQFKILANLDGSAKSPFTYDLVSFEQNFTGLNDNNAESLFEIQVKDVAGTSSQSWNGEGPAELQSVATAQVIAPAEAGAWHELYPTNKLFFEFQKELTTTGDFDKRMYATLVWDNTIYKPLTPASTDSLQYYQRAYTATNFKNDFDIKCRIRKYQNWQNPNEGVWQSQINEKVLRYADILLMYAEVLTKQNRQAEAYGFVNKIRIRAGLSELTPSFTADQMFAEIKHQRMLEFFREGMRFYDLKRWNAFDDEFKATTFTLWDNSQVAINAKVGYEYFQVNPAKYNYLPIPQAEINNNKLMVQNSLW